MVTSSPLKTLEDLALACQFDPLQFVCCAYPWDTGLLDGEVGPDTWQVEVLEHLQHALLDPAHEGALRIGIASGHGIGKGALSAWIIQWYMTCRPRPQIVVTANTQSQLLTKTWRELAKWHNLSLFQSWFAWTKTGYFKRGAEESWFAAAIPWNENKAEAFQGAHDKYVLILEDEASAIPDTIHDTIEGSMTTPQALWLKFGNPTRNTGRFKEIFAGGRFAHRWWTRQIDSRTCKKADQAQIAQWIADYGDDSDFVRVRVKGIFPRAGSTQFIGDDLIQRAKDRERVVDATAPVVMGVDVARFGDDRSVIVVRKGPQLLHKRGYREKSTVDVAGYVVEGMGAYKPQAVFIDTDGVGGGVYDIVVSLGYEKVHEVHSGAVARDTMHYANKRAEMWAGVKAWLEHRGQLSADDTEVIGELTGIEYGYDLKGRLQMEQKKDMKARGLASPDEADALVMTFAAVVAPLDLPTPEPPHVHTTWRGSQHAWMG
jgi:hypothetical protein